MIFLGLKDLAFACTLQMRISDAKEKALSLSMLCQKGIATDGTLRA